MDEEKKVLSEKELEEVNGGGVPLQHFFPDAADPTQQDDSLASNWKD